MSGRLNRKHFVSGLGLTFAGSTAKSGAAAQQYTLRFSIAQPAASVFGATAIRLATEVAHRTNGQVKIDVYPSEELAGQQASVDGLMTGVVDLTIQSSTVF